MVFWLFDCWKNKKLTGSEHEGCLHVGEGTSMDVHHVEDTPSTRVNSNHDSSIEVVLKTFPSPLRITLYRSDEVCMFYLYLFDCWKNKKLTGSEHEGCLHVGEGTSMDVHHVEDTPSTRVNSNHDSSIEAVLKPSLPHCG